MIAHQKFGSLSLRDGARLEASTSGQGNAGTIKVNAADFFTISGKSSNFNSGLFVNSQSTTGTAGDIIVTCYAQFIGKFVRLIHFSVCTWLYLVVQSCLLNCQLKTNSPRVTLDNGGKLNPESASGNSGDINLQSNLLLLRRGGQISTTAGTALAGGNGGNINIDAGFIDGVAIAPATGWVFDEKKGEVTLIAEECKF